MRCESGTMGPIEMPFGKLYYVGDRPTSFMALAHWQVPHEGSELPW